MKTINIKGKEYVMVHERIREFRTNDKYKGFNIITEVQECTDDHCRIIAKIYDEKNNLCATGHALEYRDDSFINKTSYLENCETSAIGRALGLLGIGIETAFASANEVSNAATKQEDTRQWMTEKQFRSALKRIKDGEDDVLSLCDKAFKMKKEYRKALQESVPERLNLA